VNGVLNAVALRGWNLVDVPYVGLRLKYLSFWRLIIITYIYIYLTRFVSIKNNPRLKKPFIYQTKIYKYYKFEKKSMNF
jgi:hypothetical protein